MQIDNNMVKVFRHSKFDRTLDSGVKIMGSVCLKVFIPIEQKQALDEFLTMAPSNEQIMHTLLSSIDQPTITALPQ